MVPSTMEKNKRLTEEDVLLFFFTCDARQKGITYR